MTVLLDGSITWTASAVKSQKVVHAGYSCNHNCDRYSIDADGGRYNWDEGCFQESVPSIEEEELTQLLFSKEVIP